MSPTSPSLTIKLHLLEVGRTVVDLAEAIGATRTMVSQVIHGHSESPRLRREIAAELSMTYLELWGEEDPGVDRLPPGRSKGLTLVNQSGESAPGAAGGS